ncbi:MAG TPA: 4-hydroxy-tetrahydrodipicolinate reductase [Acidimicrobiales bacterium]|nr:4-hydroxy-tetrahydrodipicolinate reductase [Acidimicrobiales bacterium]
MRVAVAGAAGKMGRTVLAAVSAEPDLDLVAACDPAAAGATLRELAGLDEAVTVTAGPEGFAPGSVDALVDFTVAPAALADLRWCASNGVHGVCGTTGLGAAALTELAAAFGPEGAPNCVLAPNFAISAVLMMRLAALAAPYFSSAEIIELHHDQKRDAPSGTALETARRIAEARAGAGPFGADPTEVTVLEGARGGVAEAGVHLHSVRLAGLVAHQEVLFGTTGQSLTLRQDSYDRTSFMPGVLLALRKVATTPGFTVGLDALLDRAPR